MQGRKKKSTSEDACTSAESLIQLKKNELVQVSPLEPNHAQQASRLAKNFTIQSTSLQKLEEVVKEDSLQPFNDFLCEHFNVCINLEQLLRITLYEKAEELIRVFHLQEDRKQQVYVHKFLDFVLDFTNRFGNDLEEFLNYWERKEGNLSVSMPKSSQAVRIMTTHKSKGLQFPIVIVPFADWETEAKSGSTLMAGNGKEIPLFLPCRPSFFLSIKIWRERNLPKFISKNCKLLFWIPSTCSMWLSLAQKVNCLSSRSMRNRKDREIKTINHLLDFYLQQSEINVTDFATQEVELENGTLEAFELQKICSPRRFGSEGNWKKTKRKRMNFSLIQSASFCTPICEGKSKPEGLPLVNWKEKLEISDLQDARQQGILVHYAFEQVKYVEDIPKAVKALANEGKIGAEEVESLIEQMATWLLCPKSADISLAKKA